MSANLDTLHPCGPPIVKDAISLVDEDTIANPYVQSEVIKVPFFRGETVATCSNYQLTLPYSTSNLSLRTATWHATSIYGHILEALRNAHTHTLKY